LERGRQFVILRAVSPYGSEWLYNSNIKPSKVNVIRNANVTIVLRAHLCLKWIDLRQTKTKKITDPFYTTPNTFHQ